MNEDLEYVTRIVAENINDGIFHCDPGGTHRENLMYHSEVISTTPETGVVEYIYNGKLFRITVTEVK